METNLKFHKNLKDWRIERGLSQKELSQALNIPVSTYANWEQGRRNPGVQDIYQILSILNISANDLFN
ncbi:MAG: helix-turn-helix transcriptional regulator [Clostridia bacterium]|nr:helix-turn-helix transcriptional regulator [Clostridia bacterium]